MITLTASEFLSLLGWLPAEEARKVFEQHPVAGAIWCKWCNGFAMPHAHGQDQPRQKQSKRDRKKRNAT